MTEHEALLELEKAARIIKSDLHRLVVSIQNADHHCKQLERALAALDAVRQEQKDGGL